VRKLWRDYNLSIVLTALFLISWMLQFWAGWDVYQAEELTHGEVADLSGYLAHFWAATFENWQSEFLQLASFVVLSAYLQHRFSPQSKDGDEKMQADITELKLHTARLAGELEALRRTHESATSHLARITRPQRREPDVSGD
jgi:hypothetical protein